jgi:hypothetical protein
MENHWILRIGDGSHFKRSSDKSIWGIDSKKSGSKIFMTNVKEGDLLWFVTGKSGGQIIAVATFVKTNERVLGPLIPLTHTNDELGWTDTDGNWNIEVHYANLYNLTECKLYSKIKYQLVIRKYDKEDCIIDLPSEYKNIVRYSKITKKME